MNTSLTEKAIDAANCVLFLTGKSECVARFEHGTYQLLLSSEQGEERVELGFSGSRVLERLLREPGQVVSREELLQYAWEDRVVSQGSLNHQIYTLRQIFCDTSSRIIQTLPRRGYLFNPAYLVQPVGAASSQAPAPALSSEQEPAHRTPARKIMAEPPPTRPRLSRAVLFDRLARCTPLMACALMIVLAIVTLGTRVWERAPATISQSVAYGALSVLYVARSEGLLERLRGDTSQIVESIAQMARKPTRLIVSSTPGFFELQCLRENGRVDWLKVHRTQVSTVAHGHLRSCL